MDRRSLIFIISLTVTLFAVNSFFEYMDSDRKKEWYEQQRIKKETEEKRVSEEIKKRSVSTSELPIVSVYEDSSNNSPRAHGVIQNDVLIVLAWDGEMPQQLTSNGIQWKRLSQSVKMGQPVLYSQNPIAKLHVTPLVPVGTYDLQIATLNTIEPTATLGDYSDGIFSFPGKNPPSEPALALWKHQGNFSVVGYFNADDKRFTSLSGVSALLSFLDIKEPVVLRKTDQNEKFYVIETPYQQLVFSDKGGALVEINLPFRTEENQKSVVKEINIDREIIENHPRNALFPQNGFYTPGNNPKGSFTFNQLGQLGGYYPLIRRGISGSDSSVNPKFYSLNLLSDSPEISELTYQVVYFDTKKIVFEASYGQKTITKTYSIAEEGEIVPYCIELELKMDGVTQNTWLTSGIPEVELQSGVSSPVLKFRSTSSQGKTDVEALKLPKDNDPLLNTLAKPDWICNSNGFFGVIIDPLTSMQTGMKATYVPGTVLPSRVSLIDQTYDRYPASSMPGYALMSPTGSYESSLKFRIYAGPFAESTLKQVDRIYTDPKTGLSPEYSLAQSYHGYFAFISRPFAKFLFFLMNMFHSISGSWALSIFLITVVLRIILYPLNSWSMKSMAKMQQVAPEMEAIKKKFKKDPKRMQLEIATLYRDRGINPLSGCFPLLIQMPFLLGMFDLLKSTFALRGAVFIPGWIDNLAAPDVLFSWSRPLWFIGTEFHLLPILLGLIMYLQQKLMSPASAIELTDEQKQQKVMMSVMMPIMLTFFFYSVPSGLNIYWISSMLIGIPQQWWTNKKMQNMQWKPAKKKR